VYTFDSECVLSDKWVNLVSMTYFAEKEKQKFEQVEDFVGSDKGKVNLSKGFLLFFFFFFFKVFFRLDDNLNYQNLDSTQQQPPL